MGSRAVSVNTTLSAIKMADGYSALVVEEEVKVESVVDGEECWLSSGVRGFIFGKIKLQTQ